MDLKPFSRLLIGVLAAALLSGCQTPASAPPPAPPPAQVAPPSGTNPKAVTDLTGGAFRLAIPALPKTWNPDRADGPGASFYQPIAPLLPNYWQFDETGVAALNPDFLESATWVEPKTVVLALNPKARWGDGAPIRPTDWVATWAALNGSNPAFRVAPEASWRQISALTGDEKTQTVRLTFVDPNPSWSWLLRHGPLRAESVATPEIFNEGWSKPKAGWFSGPFTVTHIDEKQGLITAARNPHYPRPAVLDQVTFRVVDQVVAAFRNNELDALPVPEAPKDLATEQVRTASSQNRLALEIDPAWIRDLGLRQAISAAVDPTTVAQAASPGAEIVRNQFFATSQAGYTDAAARTGLTVATRATSEIMSALGWRLDSEGFWAKDGKQFVVSVGAADGLAGPGQQAVVADLSAAGIKAQADPAGPVRLIRSSITRDPLTNALDQAARPGASAAFVDLVRQAEKQTAGPRRLDLLTQAATSAWLDAVFVPLIELPQVTLVRPKAANIGSFGLALGDWATVGWTG